MDSNCIKTLLQLIETEKLEQEKCIEERNKNEAERDKWFVRKERLAAANEHMSKAELNRKYDVALSNYLKYGHNACMWKNVVNKHSHNISNYEKKLEALRWKALQE
jgi:hypothetical protein